MKHVLSIAVLVFVVAACNLSSKLKNGSNSNNSNSSSSSSNESTSIGGEQVEQPNPTAAQTAALANGETVKWDQQGITFTLPPGWKKQSVSTEMFNYGSGDGAFLIVNVSPMAPDFPTEISLRASHEAQKVGQKNGKVDEVKYLELDGVRGVQFRESKPEMADDIRRLQWLAYRKYAGQTQLLTFILSGRGDNFVKHQDELYAILYSTKLVH